jgi:DNA primase catalytic subunit
MESRWVKKHKYKMPRGMRYSTLAERAEFYCNEFNTEALLAWQSFRKTTVLSFLVGKYTQIYLKQFEEIRDDVVVIDDYRDDKGMQQYLLKYLPEGVYYDTNHYEDLDICRGCPHCYEIDKCLPCKHYVGQELVFDLDPENVYCPIHGDLDQKMKAHQGRMLCMIEFKILRKKAVLMYRELKQTYSKIRVIYSGRGFHIHVLDSDTVYLTRSERSALAKRCAKRFPIDEWVTAGNIKLIRLPYTLHGMISRICVPIDPNEIEAFNPINYGPAVPRFLSFEST